MQGVRAIIAVGSGKGGVGKSTVAVNLAAACARVLSESGQGVGLLDADIYGPSLPRLLSLHNHPPPDLSERDRLLPVPVPEHLQLPNLRVLSMGFLMASDAAAVWRGPMVTKAIDRLSNGAEWGSGPAPTRVLFVDLPPGTGDSVLSVCQRVKVNAAVLVSQPARLSIDDAIRGAKMFSQLQVPLLGVVANMCGPVFGSSGAAVAAALEAPLLGELPLHSAIARSGEEGRPIGGGGRGQVAAEAAEAAAVFESAARRILDELAINCAPSSSSSE